MAQKFLERRGAVVILVDFLFAAVLAALAVDQFSDGENAQGALFSALAAVGVGLGVWGMHLSNQPSDDIR